MSKQILLKWQTYIATAKFSYHKMEIIDTVTVCKNETETT